MTIVGVLFAAGFFAAGLCCLVRPLAVTRWYRKSMEGILAWPPPNAPERDVMAYLIFWGAGATFVGGVGLFALLFGHVG